MPNQLASASLSELYVSILNRAPDADGLAYWLDAMARGASLAEIGANWFNSQSEVQSNYPEELSGNAFITQIYQNVLGRPPEADGLAYWLSQFEAGVIPRDNFVNAIINGAKAPTGGLSDAALLANRAEVGLQYAQLNIDGGALAQQVIQLATANPNSVTLAQTVLTLLPLAAAAPQAETALSNLATLINTVVQAQSSAPETVSGLITYLNAVSTELSSNSTADIGAVLTAAATTTSNATSDPAILDNAESLATTTVTAPETVTETTTTTTPPATGGTGGGTTTPTFTVAISDAGVVSFGGTATSTITLTVFDDSFSSGTPEGFGTITATRGGITTTLEVTSGTHTAFTGFTLASGQVLQTTAELADGLPVAGSGTMTITANATDWDSNRDYQFDEVTVGATLQVTAGNVVAHSNVDLGNVAINVSSGATLAGSSAQLSGKTINGAGAVVISSTAAAYGTSVDLTHIQVDVTFNVGGDNNTLRISSGGKVIVNAASVTGDTLAITGVAEDATEILQVQGTTGQDTFNLGAFTTTDAVVVVTGLGGVDTINLSGSAVEHVAYLSATDGGATGDVINGFAVGADLLLFKQTDFGASGVSLAGAGNKSTAVNGAASGKANLTALGTDFNGVIRIADNSVANSGDFSDVAAIAAAAIEGSNNGINVILLIDNGISTRAYFWDDGVTTSDSIVDATELTLIGTLVDVGDATTVNAIIF